MRSMLQIRLCFIIISICEKQYQWMDILSEFD